MKLTRRHLWFGLPFLTAGAGGVGFYDILRRMQAGSYDPHSLPSPLIGKRPPAFTLPGMDGKEGFSSAAFLALKQPVLVNWFASWCQPCQQEVPFLHQLAMTGRRIWGIAYEDQSTAIAAYLDEFSNPYQRLAVDQSGLTAINWGVYGVPETYFIDKTGIVRLRYAGPLNDDVINHQITPLFDRYS